MGRDGAYSAVLRDASLLQLTFDVDEDLVLGHRLAYVPRPVVVGEALLAEGELKGSETPLRLMPRSRDTR